MRRATFRLKVILSQGYLGVFKSYLWYGKMPFELFLCPTVLKFQSYCVHTHTHTLTHAHTSSHMHTHIHAHTDSVYVNTFDIFCSCSFASGAFFYKLEVPPNLLLKRSKDLERKRSYFRLFTLKLLTAAVTFKTKHLYNSRFPGLEKDISLPLNCTY